MIESGISNWALANATIRVQLGQSAIDLAAKTYSAFDCSSLQKQPTLPGIVLDRLKSPDADDTLDARSAAPGTMIEGRFQFGSCAQDSATNPQNASGYLSAALLSQAIRRQLMAMATGGSEFPDGTLVKDVWVIDEFDAHFELGAQGYIFRRVLQVGILFQETS